MTWDNTRHWLDTDGKPLHAHGGGFWQENGYYYWFGENRERRNKVSVYRSRDLAQWEFRRHIITLDSPFEPVYFQTDPEMDPHGAAAAGTGSGCIVERPKVIRNPLTGRYVLWAHWENGQDYTGARALIASCDTIDGEYVYHGSFNPIGHMSRDCTLFVDDDGSAYFISAARDNADLHMYRLSEDYLSIAEHVKTLWPSQYREAPAVMKSENVYFMVTSGCTGWPPNQGTYAYAVGSLLGPWTSQQNLGGVTTWDTQPTCILPIRGSETTTYLYVGDRWDPAEYGNSAYVMLPLRFPTDTSMELDWQEHVVLDVGTGAARHMPKHTDVVIARAGRQEMLHRMKCHGLDTYLAPAETFPKSGSNVVQRVLSYASGQLYWIVAVVEEERVVLVHADSGLALQPASAEAEAPVLLAERTNASEQQWECIELGGGWAKLVNAQSKLALTYRREEGSVLVVTEEVPGNQARWGWGSAYGHPDPQAFAVVPVYDRMRSN
ncbi:family 43 glycosylhydrolase [Paenibacillus swuensis]|uniref:family 43 glycosylhydrolase n=1 Tax=Paenibacillus swuensis TaxID=1178515 RepID=UPI000837FABB|nr:family 43 glycosylhydrolase [Paenibacillus swuensis]